MIIRLELAALTRQRTLPLDVLLPVLGLFQGLMKYGVKKVLRNRSLESDERPSLSVLRYYPLDAERKIVSLRVAPASRLPEVFPAQSVLELLREIVNAESDADASRHFVEYSGHFVHWYERLCRRVAKGRGALVVSWRVDEHVERLELAPAGARRHAKLIAANPDFVAEKIKVIGRFDGLNYTERTWTLTDQNGAKFRGTFPALSKLRIKSIVPGKVDYSCILEETTTGVRVSKQTRATYCLIAFFPVPKK